MTEPVPEPLLAPLSDLVKWLEATGTQAIIVGGVAVSFLGRPRFTRDIDALTILAELEGDSTLLTEGRRISVIGSRNASREGIARAKAFTEALVRCNYVVVSGLAEGVDTAAHETAIAAGGKTIAVLGTPLDKTYPATNAKLLETIKRDHLAISQFPEGHPSRREHFPRRNRTMALISDATVIVEASAKSGTRYQGWETLRLGRMVFLMRNVADNPDLTWAQEMISYGAQVLTRESLPDVLEDIPSFTASVAEPAF